jgi:hypothetical protein
MPNITSIIYSEVVTKCITRFNLKTLRFAFIVHTVFSIILSIKVHCFPAQHSSIVLSTDHRLFGEVRVKVLYANKLVLVFK